MSERGKLRVDIDGNASGFQQTLNGMKTSVKHFANETRQSWSIGSLAGGIFGGAAAMLSFEGIKSSLESFLGKAKYLKDISEQLEMSAEATQKWEMAADRLGVSFGTIQTVLTSIQQKRFEARTSKEAADLFSDLGISRQSVLDTEGVNASDFARMVMSAGGRDALSRGIFGKIAGRRGIKALGAGALFGQSVAPISPEAMQMADRAERLQKAAGGATGATWSMILDKLSPLFGVPSKADQAFWNKVATGAPINSTRKTTPAATEAVKDAIADPLSAILREEREKRNRELHDARLRTNAAERGNLNPTQRRASIRKDLRDAETELGMLVASSLVRIMTPQEMLRIEELKQRRAGFIGDLRERPDFIATSVGARVGLFSGSDMGSQDLNRQVVNLLRLIEQNTNGRD